MISTQYLNLAKVQNDLIFTESFCLVGAKHIEKPVVALNIGSITLYSKISISFSILTTGINFFPSVLLQ